MALNLIIANILWFAVLLPATIGIIAFTIKTVVSDYRNGEGLFERDEEGDWL